MPVEGNGRALMTSLAIGIASGLGNGVYLLPAIKALKLLGNRVTLFCQTDFRTTDIWKRCVFADEVLEAPADVDRAHFFSGPYVPPAWRRRKPVEQYALSDIHECEWRSNLRMARKLGWEADPPDVSDWCRDLQRTGEYDIGITPGSKASIWLRKRYPRMREVAEHFLASGRRVALFGLGTDGLDGLPGERINTDDIAALPDQLAKCRVIIGGDTGPAHLASSLGIPVVMVYTGTSQVKAEPVGRPHRQVYLELPCRPCVSTPLWHACDDWKCQAIEPANIIEAAEELLNE